MTPAAQTIISSRAGEVSRRRWLVLQAALRNRLLAFGCLLACLFVAMASAPGLFTPRDPYKMDMKNVMKPPTTRYWLGTDTFGRDVFTRVVYGARSSLGIALVSVSVASGAGATLGLVAGFSGGLTDQILSRLMDIVFGFPSLLLAIAVAGILGPSQGNVILAIAIVYTPFFFRVARGPTLAEKERDYIQAAHAVGVSVPRMLLRHLLPNVMTPVVVQTSVTLAYAILAEASLSYLGLGIQPPHPSWGSILNEGRPYLQIAPWISVFPGLTMMLAVLSFNLVGDGLRDLWDPQTYS